MTVHHFIPSIYYTTFGSHPPALRIADGDTVITTTLDAWGMDFQGRQVMPKGNPQSGPFYIEGAEPGDTLAVHLDHLAPNRRTGFSLTVVAPNVVVPEALSYLPARRQADWRIDPASQTAALASDFPALPAITLPLNPMLGCLGVAPAGGQAISTATSGDYGGNMDYRGFVAGVTVYFPVFVPGALLFMGDGHAVQGDGEVVGTGIETSFEVTFTVHLLKGKSIQRPRGENRDDIFTVGNARPLELGVQLATTDMLIWLYEDYGLDGEAASTLLGMCGHYDVGNIYDPAFTMVCRLSKKYLPKRRESPQ
ncbi:MAG TPA: acetamidase/formamidase family protein [Anaerolineaceae bacterium]